MANDTLISTGQISSLNDVGYFDQAMSSDDHYADCSASGDQRDDGEWSIREDRSIGTSERF